MAVGRRARKPGGWEMTLIQQVEEAAERAAAGGGGPWLIAEADGAVQVVCDLTAVETLACAFTRFEVSNQAWAAAPIAAVQKIADGLAKRLTYLLEPIRPIETDQEACIVQMRSSPPRRSEDRSSYYELQVRRGGVISLCRYEKQPGDVRQAVPIQVTREVFRHLFSDFVAAA
jgi:hypothetical protein